MNRPLLLFAVVASIGAPGAALAVPVTYGANLSGAAENPANASPGTGSTVVTYDGDLHTLRVQAEFADLTAGTTAAHIHCCVVPPETVGVATTVPTFPGFPAGVMSGTYDQTLDLTEAGSFNPTFVTTAGGTVAAAEAMLASGLAGGEAYLNIHTSNFPAGEIRGFLAVVPLPAALPLFGAGLAALAMLRRTR